mgnify:CR=1 FL=1
MPETILHYPRLDTMLMVEEVLKNADTAMSKSELMRRLPKQIMRQTLLVILDYLEKRGMIMIGKKGILWIQNDNPKMRKLIESSRDA